MQAITHAETYIETDKYTYSDLTLVLTIAPCSSFSNSKFVKTNTTMTKMFSKPMVMTEAAFSVKLRCKKT